MQYKICRHMSPTVVYTDYIKTDIKYSGMKALAEYSLDYDEDFLLFIRSFDWRATVFDPGNLNKNEEYCVLNVYSINSRIG